MCYGSYQPCVTIRNSTAERSGVYENKQYPRPTDRKSALTRAADLGAVRGSNFEQTLAVDGAPIHCPQTGHHNLDLPVPLSAIVRIDVVKSAGIIAYGGNCTGGVTNSITRRADHTELGAKMVAVPTARGNSSRPWHRQRPELKPAFSGCQPCRQQARQPATVAKSIGRCTQETSFSTRCICSGPRQFPKSFRCLTVECPSGGSNRRSKRLGP